MSARWPAALAAPVALVAAVTVALAAPPNADFASLPSAKALAIVPDGSQIRGLAQGQPHDLAAALAALDACEALRGAGQPPCEMARLNDVRITSGAEIRAGVPDGAHPLNLWQLTSPSATVYLAGSVHVLKPSVYPLPEPYEQAFTGADHLVVEIDPSTIDEAGLQRKTLSYGALPAGQRLEEVLPEALMTRLTQALARLGIPAGRLSALKPAMVTNQLLVLRLMTLGYRPEHGIEQHFLARRGDRTVLELETIDDQLRLLFDQPMALQIQLLSDTLDQLRDIEPLLAGMVTAWLTGDDEKFMAMFEQQSGDSDLARRFTEALLAERNQKMADRIGGYLERPGTYFVLVGAAHLIGDDGIPALLERSGRTPRRILSDGSFLALREVTHRSSQ